MKTRTPEQLVALDRLDHSIAKLQFISLAVNYRKLHRLSSTAGLYYILDDIREDMEAVSEVF